VLEYDALKAEQASEEEVEERRLFYVAMTRARERLILSGAAKLDPWATGSGAGPIGWIGPALIPELAVRAERREDGVAEGVAVRFMDSERLADTPSERAVESRASPEVAPPPASPELAAGPRLAVTEVSYSALEEHRRCGYRFYAERVLRLPSVEDVDERTADSGPSSPGALSGIERGLLVHSLLERLDFRRPVVPSAALVRPGLGAEEAEEVVALVRAFTSSELCARLGRATSARAEQRFAFLLGGRASAAASASAAEEPVLIRGVFDVIAREADGGMLVVDYKTDRLEGAEPEEVVESSYTVQRLVYALAALRAGATSVEVVHTFLEQANRPVVARFSASDAAELERELIGLTAGMVAGEFEVSPVPHRALCRGCPAQGGLCSWPLALTRRATPDQLF
jgi:ATP-dependent exoDNAse (exonuclease V) beta subunit